MRVAPRRGPLLRVSFNEVATTGYDLAWSAEGGKEASGAGRDSERFLNDAEAV